MRSPATFRRRPAAVAALLLGALTLTGGVYMAAAPDPAVASVPTADAVAEGNKLFQANCATCHGTRGEGIKNAQPDQKDKGKAIGPSLIGVGAASVDFQVGTGRMPLSGSMVQAKRTYPSQFTQEQTEQLAAFVASLGTGPAIPTKEQFSPVGGNASRGSNIFRVNCAMCHNFAGAGGALTRGKYAPTLMNVDDKHIYEAMLTGPQSMPVFSETNLSPQAKKDVIAYLKELEKDENFGGHNLGNLGPVGDGFFLWLLGIPMMLAAAIWLGKRAA